MKRLLLLILLFVCPCLVPAWNYSYSSEEKIYLFDVKVAVQQNGEIQVTENITLNVKHQKIRRGIYRDLPDSIHESAKPVSLTMDGETHPFFTEKRGNFLRVNFGNNDYISQGKHTYSFTYNYTGAINFLKDYDELYWNVTGNDWDFTIDKAQIEITFPENTKVLEEGISLYTGRYGQKGKDAKQTSNFVFETTKPLLPKEGFTVTIPFEKGAVQQPVTQTTAVRNNVNNNLNNKANNISKPVQVAAHAHDNIFSKLWFGIGGIFSKPSLSFIILLIILIIYCFVTWFMVGHDPFYPAVPQYKPPKDISPAFLSYLKKGSIPDILTCIILNLAMKGNIKIEEQEKSFLFLKSKKTVLFLQNKDMSTLSKDEEILVLNLFPSFARDFFVLNDWNSGDILERTGKKIKKLFDDKKENYIVSNWQYSAVAILLLLALGIIPNYQGEEYWIMNVIFIVFIFFTFLMSTANKLVALVLAFFILPFLGKDGLLIVGIITTLIYIKLIPNVTSLGQEVFEYVKGFEKYIKTAEAHRFELSDPIDPQKVFCDYLAYAYAIGLDNKWVKKFSNILSQATVQETLSRTGGISSVNSLRSSIANAMPSHSGSGSGGGGGSFGGGSSGGGHGGGGGGGR